MTLRNWTTLYATILLATSAHGATLSGDVTSEGKPLRGAQVTLFGSDKVTSETVLTNSKGHYSLATRLSGALTLRGRAPMSADATVTLTVPASPGIVTQSLNLRRLTTPQEISDSLPASAHFTRIQFPTLIQRQQFQTDCLSCHQIGNPLTRKVRELNVWRGILMIMVQFCGYTTQVHVNDYADALFKAFDGTMIKARESTKVDEEALNARVTEWKLPSAKLAHDTDFNERDGKFYTVDEAVDQVLVTDPKTNQTIAIPIPELGVPAGGRFATMGLPIPFLQTNRHGVHSLQMGPDGKYYMTGAIASEIVVFDPVTHEFKPYSVPGNRLYPHTLRIDKQGIIWFTIQVTNQFGRFDPKSHDMKVVELPTDMARKDERSPAPYGLDVNPIDGSIWYTKLWANKVGRIDPKTLQVKEWIPPVIGPRRARFDAKGGLWIPGYGDGKLARLDTRTMKYEVYQIPALADDEVEAPYAVAVEPKTQNVWITANMSDRMFRFVPKTKQFTAYPLPVRGTYFRDMVFTGDGRVCATNNSLPLLPGMVEGNSDSLMCLEPTGHRSAGNHE
jgi:streptogramin lyase